MSEFSTAFDHVNGLDRDTPMAARPNVQVIADEAEIAAKFELPGRLRFWGFTRQMDGRVALLFHDPKLPERGMAEAVPTIRRAPAPKVQPIDERYIQTPPG